MTVIKDKIANIKILQDQIMKGTIKISNMQTLLGNINIIIIDLLIITMPI